MFHFVGGMFKFQGFLSDSMVVFQTVNVLDIWNAPLKKEMPHRNPKQPLKVGMASWGYVSDFSGNISVHSSAAWKKNGLAIRLRLSTSQKWIWNDTPLSDNEGNL